MSEETLAYRIEQHEGFSSIPYWDKIGKKWTWGFGFTNITEEEAHIVLRIRLHHIYKELDTRIGFFWNLPVPVQEVLIEMAFQMGVKGLMGFHKMLEYLEQGEYEKAAGEIKNSYLYKETPNRAKDYMRRIVSIGT